MSSTPVVRCLVMLVHFSTAFSFFSFFCLGFPKKREVLSLLLGSMQDTEDKQTLDIGDKQDLQVPQRVPSTTSYGESHSSHAEVKADDAEEDSEKKAALGKQGIGREGLHTPYWQLDVPGGILQELTTTET